MAPEIYDQNLDFAWVEEIADEGDNREGSAPQWHPPEFTCNRRFPSRRRALVVGIGGAFDFFGTSRLWDGSGLYRTRTLEPSHANALAIYSDWCAVGQDLHVAVDHFERSELTKVTLKP